METRRLRWITWSSTVLITLMVFAGIAIRHYTGTPEFRALLRAQILAAANDALKAELRFSEITGSIWGDMEFHNVAVEQNGETVIAAPAVRVDVGLLGQIYTFLKSSSIRIARIDVLEPRLNLIQDPDRKWNVTRLLKERKERDAGGTLTVSVDRLNIKDGAIDVRLAAGGKRARLTSFSARAAVNLRDAGVNVDLDHLAFTLGTPGLPDTAWTSVLSFRQSDQTSVVNVKQLSVASAESRVTLAGTVRDLAAPTADLTLVIEKGSAREITAWLPLVRLRQDISGRLRASGPLSDLQLSAVLTAANGQVSASMTADWTQIAPRLRGNFEFREFVAEKVLVTPDLRGVLNGQISFEGTGLEQARVTAQGTISRPAFKQWEIGHVAFSGQLQDRHLDFRLRSQSNGVAELKGSVRFVETPVYEIALLARAVDIAQIAPGRGAPAATVSLDARIKGRGTDPETMQFESDLTLLPSSMSGVPVEGGSIRVSAHNGTLILRQARLFAAGSTLTAKGNIPLVSRAGAGNVTYVVNFGELSPWLKLARIEGSGSAEVNGRIGGSLRALRFEGRASVRGLEIAGAQLDRGNIAWNLAGASDNRWKGQIQLGAQTLRAAVPLSSVQAKLSLQDTRPLTVSGDIVARDADQRTHRIQGRLVYTAARADLLLTQISLQLVNGTWRSTRPAHFLMAENVIRVKDFQLERNGQSVVVNGTTGHGAQDLALKVDRFPLADLRPYFRAAPEVTGGLSLAMQIKGTARQPLIQANANVDDLTVAGQRYAGLKFEAAYGNERLNFDLRLLQDSTHQLVAAGVVPVYVGWGERSPLALPGDADLRIYSAGLNPAFLSLFSKDVQNLDGTLSFDLLLRGPIRALEPQGTVRFQNGSARLIPLGLSLSGIELQAHVSPAAVDIARLTARSGDGRLNGTGRLAIKALRIARFGLSLDAENFRVIATRQYEASASGHLGVEGTFAEPWIRGALTVRGTARPDLALLKRSGVALQDPTIVIVRNERELAAVQQGFSPNGKSPSRGEAGKRREDSALYRRLGLAVAVTLARDTWVQLDEGSIEVAGKVRIDKSPDRELTLSGEILGTRGSYSFHGRRFRIAQAVLTFTGGERIDPGLDIVGRYRAPQHEIELVVGGYASKPTLNLRSDPALEQADILSVLLFGKPVADLNRDQQISLQAQALKAGANFIASDLTRSVARTLGLDTLSFGVGETVTQGQLEVGKYVTESVFVSSRQEFGGDGQQEYSIEYNIAPNWQIKSSTNPDGNSGIDILWRKRY